MYKKLSNDPLRDTNSRRREQREINQGQKPKGPIVLNHEAVDGDPATIESRIIQLQWVI